MLDQAISAIELIGFNPPEEVYQQIEDSMMNQPAWRQALYPSAATLVVPFILAGVLYGFFSAILGYDTTYKHVVAIVVHAGVLTTLSILVSYPVFYLKQSMSSPTSLFVFFPFLDETGVLARFLGIIDLFRLWWLANLAIGLGVLFKKRVGPIFTGFLILYGVIAVVYAGVSAFFSGD
jgi:hypothetical protein